MNEWLGLALLFLLVSGLSFAALSWDQLRRQRRAERLQPAGADADSRPDFVLGEELTPALAAQLPGTGRDRSEIAPELRAAGFYAPSALTNYLAIRAALVLVSLLGAGIVAVLVEPRHMGLAVVGGLCLALLGYSLPRFYVRSLARSRSREIERGLPVAVDLLALGITGGQNILAALARVSRELRLSFPVLAEELEIVRSQASLNTLSHALQQWSDRVQVAEVRTLALILTQSERLGTDLSTSLMEFSTNFRTQMRQRADAQANRASVWMIFPSLFCLWLPAAIVLVGPILFEFANKRAQTQNMLQRGSENAAKLSGPRTPTTAPTGPSAPAAK